MKVTFIVITYQRDDLLQQCLESIYKQRGLPQPYEVIVIDNNGDSAVPPPENDAVEFHLIHSPSNLGFVRGRNWAFELATGDYWIEIDDDALFHSPDDAAKLISHLERDPKCGAVAAYSLHPHTHEPMYEELPHPDKAYFLSLDTPTEIPYFYGYCHALRASVIRQTGGFNERFGAYVEEYDLSLRIIQQGYRIIYDPRVAVYHHKSNLGRPIALFGPAYWRKATLNKVRANWRSLPQPYPLTTLLIWSAYTLYRTRQPRLIWEIWQTLWVERATLQAERNPLTSAQVAYLKKIKARLWY